MQQKNRDKCFNAHYLFNYCLFLRLSSFKIAEFFLDASIIDFVLQAEVINGIVQKSPFITLIKNIKSLKKAYNPLILFIK